MAQKADAKILPFLSRFSNGGSSDHEELEEEFFIPNAAMVGALLEEKFSLVRELSFNRGDYTGGEGFSISGMPAYVTMALERVRHQVSSPLISNSPALSCCIQHGLEALENHDDVVNLISLRRQFNLLRDNDDNDFRDNIHLLFRQITLSIPDVAMLGFETVSIRLPEDIKIRLFHKASGLGLPASKLAIVASLEILKDEKTVMKRHREYMKTSLRSFMQRLKFHRIIVEGAIQLLTNGVESLYTLEGLQIVAGRLASELRKILSELNSKERATAESLISSCRRFADL